MSGWSYVAVDADGRRQSGKIEADDPPAVRARLREMGLLPEVVEARGLHATNLAYRGGRISAGQLAMFSRQFATMLSAGLMIEKALAVLAEQPEQEQMRAVLNHVREDVVAGHNLAAAMERQPRAFPRYFCAIARAGEETGALPVVMVRLAEYLERAQAIRHKVGIALIYPAIVTVVAFLVVGILLTYVVPQIVTVFEHSRQSLPWLTQAVIMLSDLLRSTWWALLIVVVIAALAARHLLQLEPVRYRWHLFLLTLPVIGRLRSGMATARFANILAVLVGSGVPVVKALGYAGASLDDLVFRQGVEVAIASVREGVGVSRALREAGPFPSILLHLVASGEASGELPTVLEHAARQQEQIVEARLATLTALLEPLMILSMGVVVLVIVMATLEPIIEMNRLVR